MFVAREPAIVGQKFPGGVYALGNFDGVHLGHQRLFDRARELARRLDSPWGVLTFEPHPAKVLAPELAPRLITNLEDKLALIRGFGPDATVVIPFDRDLAGLHPEQFVSRILVDALRAGGAVVGYDFTFGSGRKGGTQELEGLGARFGFRVEVVPAVTVGGMVVSSTKIRAFVLAGRVYAASLLLGRPFTLSGPVVHGDGRGASLGFPTANVEVRQELLPAAGVYACWCCVGGEHLPAAVNVGRVPTFRTNGRITVEAHLLDFQGNLYGRHVVLEFVRRLRSEKRFESSDALVAQIRADVARTRKVLMNLAGDVACFEEASRHE